MLGLCIHSVSLFACCDEAVHSWDRDCHHHSHCVAWDTLPSPRSAHQLSFSVFFLKSHWKLSAAPRGTDTASFTCLLLDTPNSRTSFLSFPRSH